MPSESLSPWRDMSRGFAVQSAGNWEEQKAGFFGAHQSDHGKDKHKHVLTR